MATPIQALTSVRFSALSVQSLAIIAVVFVLALMTMPHKVIAQSSQDQEDDLLMLIPSMVSAMQRPTNTVPPLSPTTSLLCTGYRENDLSNRPMPALTRPQPGTSYQDPMFGSKITRVTNAASIDSGVMRNLYSTIQAWNADETKMILWHRGEGHYLYDGNGYQLIERLNIAPAEG